MRNSLRATKEISSASMGAAMQAYMDALRGVFQALLGIAVLGAVVNLSHEGAKISQELVPEAIVLIGMT